MGGHEFAVKDVLADTQRQSRYQFRQPQLRALATWISILALLSQCVSGSRKPLTPASARADFRRTDEIPAGTHIWLGRSGEVPWMEFGIIHPLDPGVFDVHDGGLSRYTYSVIFGPVAAFLVGGIPDGSEPRFQTQPAGALQRIWPPHRASRPLWRPTTTRIVAIDLNNVRWLVANDILGKPQTPPPPFHWPSPRDATPGSVVGWRLNRR